MTGGLIKPAPSTWNAFNQGTGSKSETASRSNSDIWIYMFEEA